MPLPFSFWTNNYASADIDISDILSDPIRRHPSAILALAGKESDCSDFRHTPLRFAFLLKVLWSTVLNSIPDALSQIDAFLLFLANAHVDGYALRPDPLVQIYHIHPPKILPYFRNFDTNWWWSLTPYKTA